MQMLVRQEGQTDCTQQCTRVLTAGWLLCQERGSFLEGEQRRLLAGAEQPLALPWHGEGKGAATGDDDLPATGCEHIGVLPALWRSVADL